MKEDDLRTSWPWFLEVMDIDPSATIQGLYEWAWRQLTSSPPRIFSALTKEEREDVISGVVLTCCEDNFRKLRTYKDKGYPFAVWIHRVASNRAKDVLNDRNRYLDVIPEDQPVDPPPPEIVSKPIQDCIDRLNEKCRRLVALMVLGHKPRDIAALMGEGLTNKQASNDLNYCLKVMKKCLKEAGIEHA